MRGPHSLGKMGAVGLAPEKISGGVVGLGHVRRRECYWGLEAVSKKKSQESFGMHGEGWRDESRQAVLRACKKPGALRSFQNAPALFFPLVNGSARARV